MTDIIIVGGGLVGMLSAVELSKRGARVTVLERGEPGRESSWAGGGILSPLYPWRYDEAVNRLALWSQRFYPSFAAELIETTGIDIEWTRSGLMVLDVVEAEPGRRWAQAHGVTTANLPARGLEPGLIHEGEVLLFPQVAQVRNPRVMRALRAYLEHLDITVLNHCEVSELRVQQGRCRGVKADGRDLPADAVVIASGAWSGGLLSPWLADFPIVPVRGQMLLYRAEPATLGHIILDHGHYMIPRRDGRILVGSTLEYVGFDKQTTAEGRAELETFALNLLPALADFPLEHHWAGLRPGSPDGIPRIGVVPGVEGLYVNAGHFRNGVIMGPASARLLAELVCAEPTTFAATDYLPQGHTLETC